MRDAPTPRARRSHSLLRASFAAAILGIAMTGAAFGVTDPNKNALQHLAAIQDTLSTIAPADSAVLSASGGLTIAAGDSSTLGVPTAYLGVNWFGRFDHDGTWRIKFDGSATWVSWPMRAVTPYFFEWKVDSLRAVAGASACVGDMGIGVTK